MGRPRKPKALKDLEGNRGKRDSQPEITLDGVPDMAHGLDQSAQSHFEFIAAEFGGAGVLKRADGPALAMLADLWAAYWEASQERDRVSMCSLKQRWDSAASKLGIQVIDRSRLITAGRERPDEDEQRFLKITG